MAGTGVQVFAAPGNDDFFEVDELLSASSTIELLEMKVHRLTEEHEIITSGWTNPTPWNTERECTEDELATRLGSMLDAGAGHGALHLQHPCAAQQLEDRHLSEARREHEGRLRHGQPGDGAGGQHGGARS